MFKDDPKTLEEAKAKRYHVWGGMPKGVPYQPGKCAAEVYSDHLFHQCSRKHGHGPAGLYCVVHAKKIKG